MNDNDMNRKSGRAVIEALIHGLYVDGVRGSGRSGHSNRVGVCLHLLGGLDYITRAGVAFALSWWVSDFNMSIEYCTLYWNCARIPLRIDTTWTTPCFQRSFLRYFDDSFAGLQWQISLPLLACCIVGRFCENHVSVHVFHNLDDKLQAIHEGVDADSQHAVGRSAVVNL